jgi:hypothetical protein
MNIPSRYKDPVAFLNEMKPLLKSTIQNQLEEVGGLKYYIGLEVILRMDKPGELPIYTNPPARFYSKQDAVMSVDIIDLDIPIYRYTDIGDY